jgi:hypothetical protein
MYSLQSFDGSGPSVQEEFAGSDFDTETKYAWRADVVDPQKQSLVGHPARFDHRWASRYARRPSQASSAGRPGNDPGTMRAYLARE